MSRQESLKSAFEPRSAARWSQSPAAWRRLLFPFAFRETAAPRHSAEIELRRYNVWDKVTAAAPGAARGSR
jgi:hypothetical protein